jgi:hypothetical protein
MAAGLYEKRTRISADRCAKKRVVLQALQFAEILI